MKPDLTRCIHKKIDLTRFIDTSIYITRSRCETRFN